MRLDRFDLNLLVALNALLEERNVTRAGERLYIGQSAASSALARLREYFGDDLLVPVGRRMELTPLAKSLVGPVRTTLVQARATLALKPGFDPITTERRFTICASDYVTTVLLADAVQQIAIAGPGIAIDIRSPPRDIPDAIERGSIDLIVMPEQYVDSLQHPRQRLFADTQVCVRWAGHALAGQPLTMGLYMDSGHVAVRLGDGRGVAFEEWFLPRTGRQRRIECSVDHFAALPQLIVGTQRVATVHRRLAERFTQHHPLHIVAPPFEMPPLNEFMVWPFHLQHDPAHQWLRDRLAAAAASLPPVD